MKRILIAMFAAVVMALTMSSCGVDTGYITEKEYTAPWDEQKKVYETECHMSIRMETYYVNNQPQTRTVPYQVCNDVWRGEWRTVHHDAEYRLHLRNDEGKTGKVRVDSETFEDVEVGEYFDKELRNI